GEGKGAAFAGRGAGEDDAELRVEAHSGFGDCRPFTNRVPGGRRFVGPVNPGLALAIITEPPGLEQDWRTERIERRNHVLNPINLAPRRDADAALLEEALFDRTVLRHLEAARAGSQLVAEDRQRPDRDIFELIGDDVAPVGEAPQRISVVEHGAGKA